MRCRSGRTVVPLVMGIGGAIIGGPLGAAVGLGSSFGGAVGFMIGSMVGSYLFPQKNDIAAPDVTKYPIQTAAKGIPVAKVYGSRKVAGNIIWFGDSVPYTINHYQEGGKGGGRKVLVAKETRYRRSFLIGICEGPAEVLNIWKNKKLIELTDAVIYSGDNSTNPQTTIVSENAADEYGYFPDLCCAWFENYDLGNSDSIPNFTFEVKCPVDEGFVPPAGAIAILDVNDLQDIELDKSATYYLANDIDASETSGWDGGKGFLPIGDTSPYKFTGGLYGCGHTISNLVINRPERNRVGIFDTIEGAVIQDLTIENPTINGKSECTVLAVYVTNSTIHAILLTKIRKLVGVRLLVM